MILNRLENELRYVRSMKANSERFEKILTSLIPIAANNTEYSISDNERGIINMTLQDIDRFYGRIPERQL